MLVAVPGLEADIDVAVAVDISGFGLVASFAFEDYVLIPLAGPAVNILPDEAFVYFLRERAAS